MTPLMRHACIRSRHLQIYEVALSRSNDKNLPRTSVVHKAITEPISVFLRLVFFLSPTKPKAPKKGQKKEKRKKEIEFQVIGLINHHFFHSENRLNHGSSPSANQTRLHPGRPILTFQITKSPSQIRQLEPQSHHRGYNPRIQSQESVRHLRSPSLESNSGF